MRRGPKAAHPSRRPEIVVGPDGVRPLVANLRELWEFRDTLLAFTERRVRVKYKQSLLGIAWAIIQPLAFMAVFSFALGRLAGVPGGGAPYPAFVLSALVAWNFLHTAVAFGANSLVEEASLIKKIYFPREVTVLASVAAAGVDLAIGLALFAVVGPLLGAEASPAWLLVPLLAAGVALLASGVALVLGGLNVYYRDFRHALPFLLQLWLFASPVAYPMTVVPPRWHHVYAVVNPASGLIDGFRRVLVLGDPPSSSLLALSLTASAIVAVAGYRIFKRLEPSFADVI